MGQLLCPVLDKEALVLLKWHSSLPNTGLMATKLCLGCAPACCTEPLLVPSALRHMF